LIIWDAQDFSNIIPIDLSGGFSVETLTGVDSAMKDWVK